MKDHVANVLVDGVEDDLDHGHEEQLVRTELAQNGTERNKHRRGCEVARNQAESARLFSTRQRERKKSGIV